jgi:hypothetical protein
MYTACVDRSSDEMVNFGYTFMLSSIVSPDKAYIIMFIYAEADGVVCDIRDEYFT